MHRSIWLWAVTMLFAGIANAFAFWVFARLDSAGYPRRWWRMEDFRLYSVYWKLAPKQGWSRLPLIGAGAALLIAGTALLIAVFGN